MMNYLNTSRISLGALVLSVLFFLLSLYQIVGAVLALQTTGTLDVSASDASAVISLSQDNHKAMVVGTGHAHIRLPHGAYLVFASASGKHASKVISVNSKQLTRALLDLEASSGTPSVDQINFQNLNELLESGLSSDQINILKQYFFEFSPATHTISITRGSAAPGPHNPTIDTSFSLHFTVNIDSAGYSAIATYADSESIQLNLLLPSDNSKVFDSSIVGPGTVNEGT